VESLAPLLTWAEWLCSYLPVPPADGVVTDERLGVLLRLGAEYDELDFKSMLDLSETRDAVELVKDVGAFRVKGGYIVIGVDGAGNPTGAMDTMNTSPSATSTGHCISPRARPIGITTSWF
jgi:hypothetical protein